METRNAKMICNKSGGTSTGVTYRVTLPTTWVKEMGLGTEERELELIYDEIDKCIKVKKRTN